MESSRGLKYQRTLQSPISLEDISWQYTPDNLPTFDDRIPDESRDHVILKLVTFAEDKITLSFNKQKLNRILTLDRPSKFCAVSFAQFKLFENRSNKTADYIQRFLLAGLKLNNVVYKCFGWSNSQLKSRSCLLYAFPVGETAMHKLEDLGAFKDISQVGKMAKRIGLLFSEAELGLQLSPDRCQDISDIEFNGQVFSDGCGLMPLDFAKFIARAKNITFHGFRYTPSVVQIRYRGYKGVLMVNPDTSSRRVQFRKSMRKFTGCPDITLSILDYSKPYAFGKLNGELVTLLSALGIPDETFLKKQQEYFDMISEASTDPVKAFIFMSYMNDQASADRILLQGLASVGSALKSLQNIAWAKMFDKKDTERVHFMIRQSRLLLGVCDPGEEKKLLRPNECHVRITLEGRGVMSLHNRWVIVARNPCLHPGDIRKLRVKHVQEFANLVDCIVFPSTGPVPQPSMMSGGDLDGDKFFVCWDSDLIPTTLHEPHPYPAAKQKQKHDITQDELVRYFAHWNNGSMGRISNLYRDWLRATPEGAKSEQCLQLNHLYSLSVDGEHVPVPEKLRSPPQPSEDWGPFIVDRLVQEVSNRAKRIRFGLRAGLDLNADLIQFLVAADEISLTEFELFQLVSLWASKHHVGMRQFIDHFDFGAFTAEQRSWIRTSRTMDVSPEEVEALLKNGLLQSNILPTDDLRQYRLESPQQHWRRLYGTYDDGGVLFFSMLTSALEDFTRKLLVLDVASQTRLKIGIMISKRINPVEDKDATEVGDSVVAFSFRPGRRFATGRHVRMKKGYRLSWDGVVFQLFNMTRGDTFVWLQKPRTERNGPIGLISVNLDRLGREVATNIGRVWRIPVHQAEIYVITNRDRAGHQLLDLSYGDVPTEQIIERIRYTPLQYKRESVDTIDWSGYSARIRDIVKGNEREKLAFATSAELEQVGKICCSLQDLERLIGLMHWHVQQNPPHPTEQYLQNIIAWTPRACVFLGDIIGEGNLNWRSLYRSPSFVKTYCSAVIQSTNHAPGLAQEVFEEILGAAKHLLPLEDRLDLISIISTTIRSSLLALEFVTLLVEHDRASTNGQAVEYPGEREYLTTMARNVAIDRCAEAEELSPCDEWGIPTADTSKFMCQVLEPENDELDNRTLVTASLRVDLVAPFRVGDHLRLRSALPPEDAPLQKPRILDGLIARISSGSIKIRLMEPPPLERCSWYLFTAGNNTTANAMLDTIRTLAKEKQERCRIYPILIPRTNSRVPYETENLTAITNSGLNSSQNRAVIESTRKVLTLIWGPPGTGKTTTIVRIISEWRKALGEEERILVAASTNTAVDNVMEKYLDDEEAVTQDIVRVCPDGSNLSKKVERLWVGAFVDGDINKPSPAMRAAQEKIKQAKIVFTTCTGAALGLLRKLEFAHVIIDEASQITEPNCLIALAKGCKRAALVGDHVQLRPTVTPLGQAYGYDVSLFERLYMESDRPDVAKVLLDTQYRMHPQIAEFPSERFYNGKLLCGAAPGDRTITESQFDWGGRFVRFVAAPRLPEGQESFSHSSKQNEAQARLCRTIVSNLQKLKSESPNARGLPSDSGVISNPKMSVAVLTPYVAQQKLLKSLEKRVDSPTVSSVTVATVDSFQGREADIVIFCTVRCNANNVIGFLSDERRMNVAFTRAKRGFIVVGDKETLTKSEDGGQFWREWFRKVGDP